MAIDREAREMSGAWLYKYMTVKRLREILSELNETDEVSVNRVGNISVFRPKDKDGTSFNWIGFIDLANEEFTPC